MMNEYTAEGKTSSCYFHPKEVVIGVCAFCLNERLLILAASKQENQLANNANGRSNRSFPHMKKSHQIHFPKKIFALTSLLNRLIHDIKQTKSELLEYNNQSFSGFSASSQEEDSFISIKFEDNGSTSWDKGTTTMANKISLEQNDMSFKLNQRLQQKKGREVEVKGIPTKAVVEHAEPRASLLRWRKRIGQLFQLMRWKRTSTVKGGNVGTKLESCVKVRHGHGWIRSLTKMRTKE